MQKFYLNLMLFCFISAAHAQDFKFGEVSREEVMEKSHPLEKDANAAVLFRSVSTYYEFNDSSGFVLVTDVHERIKIYNKDGFDWATKEIFYYRNGSSKENVSGIKASTYHLVGNKLVEEKLKKDGIFNEEITKYQLSTKFTMPAVTEGSVIEYQYSLRSPFVTSIDDIQLQYTIPINRLEASVKIPEFFGFVKHTNPRSPLIFKIEESKRNFTYNSTSTTRTDGLPMGRSNMQNSKIEYAEKGYTTIKDKIPALKIESHVDYISNYSAFLRWELQYTKFPNAPLENFSSTWEGVSKTIFTDGGYDKELSRTKYFEEDLDKLLAGDTDPLIKAEKIYSFVKSKVKWNKYLGYKAESGGVKVYKDGEGNVGDINLMLTAMLRYAGLKSHPVLLSTKDNGIPLFPTLKGFNYVISSVVLKGEVVLLDATDENSSFGELPGRARNWNGRIVMDQEKSDWINLMPKLASTNSFTLNLQIEGGQNLKGKSICILSGLYAKTYRDKYKNIDLDNYIQILERDKGNIQISNVETEGRDLIGSEIKESFSFELLEGIVNINGKIYLKPLLFIAENENPFKANERFYPIIFDFPSLESRVVNIMIPQGFEVESLPESAIVQINDGGGIFKFIIAQNGNFLRVESSIDLKDTVYTPNDYDILKKFYSQVVEKHAETIVLKKS